MVETLNLEGFEINERQLSRIRKQHKLWMRESGRTRGKEVDEGVENEAVDESAQPDNNGITPKTGQIRLRAAQDWHADVPQEVIVKRQQRQAQLMAESEERLKSRKRRRRTRYWAGLPPDEDLGPRFPSELTLAEGIVELNLDKVLYRNVRQSFEQICQSQNIMKKTLCGAEKWNQAKNELIGRYPQLQTIFWDPNAGFIGQTKKPMALDVICMDVTKRLRQAGQHISIADAKNTLGLTPEQGREVRAAFNLILREDFFTGKLDTTKEHWDGLKSRWIKESPQLSSSLSLGETDPAYQNKMKALESIARDVQKRNRDRQTRQAFPREGYLKRSQVNGSTNDETAPPSKPKAPKPSKAAARLKAPIRPQGPKAQQAQLQGQALLQQVSVTVDHHAPVVPSSMPDPMSTLASQALAQETQSHKPAKEFAEMQIDPSLLEAACLPSHQQRLADYGNDHDIFAELQQASAALTPRPSKPVYFRLSPNSLQKFPLAPKLWLETLPAEVRGVRDIQMMALQKLGLHGMAAVQRIEGLAASEGTEKWEIGEDDELEAYLLHVGDGKATFILEVA